MERANEDIRTRIKELGIKQWMVAEELGQNESSFCRMLRHEVSPNRKNQILAACVRVWRQRRGSGDQGRSTRA